ncbi:hypothetical protein XELAEV_18009447mg [Xenopus laevis]|uniref:Uncharacterized protein n=1 Tax=Xenopus laevis TaxID=8355 RepID=A0A974I0R5_XENLA|nr:hypothetical protein XELAEV_18009447mg [Xenopus laevis]
MNSCLKKHLRAENRNMRNNIGIFTLSRLNNIFILAISSKTRYDMKTDKTFWSDTEQDDLVRINNGKVRKIRKEK